jgi:hypothetical protein
MKGHYEMEKRKLKIGARLLAGVIPVAGLLIVSSSFGTQGLSAILHTPAVKGTEFWYCPPGATMPTLKVGAQANGYDDRQGHVACNPTMNTQSETTQGAADCGRPPGALLNHQICLATNNWSYCPLSGGPGVFAMGPRTAGWISNAFTNPRTNMSELSGVYINVTTSPTDPCTRAIPVPFQALSNGTGP